MRVALYLTHYPGPGGSTLAVRGLAQALAQAGWEAEVLAQGRSHDAYRDGPVSVRIFRRGRALPFVAPRALRGYIARTKPDLLVLTGVFHTDLPALAWLARRARIPYVNMPLGWYSPNGFAKSYWRKKAYWALVESHILRNAHAVHALSEKEASYLRSTEVPKRIVVLPQAYSADRLNGATVPPSPGAGAVHGFFGRLEVYMKGLDVLIEAFAQAAPLADRRLILQGPDDDGRKRLEALVGELGLDGQVEFREPVYGRSLDLLGEWDVVVVPSRHDCFPLTVVEAMAAGRVLLCSSETGTAEHVRRAGCGVVVEPTVAALVRGLDGLAARRDRWPEMGEAGRAYARLHFAPSAIGSAAVAAYGEILRSAR